MQTSPTSRALNDLHGISASDIWMVGDGGEIWHWNGTGWGAFASGTTRDLNGVFALTTSDVYAVGDAGTILKWDGTSWSAMASTATTDLYEIWAAGTADAWAVGAGTTVPGQSPLWRLTAAWAPFLPPTGPTAGLNDVFGVASNAVWVVGDFGLIQMWNNIDMHELQSPDFPTQPPTSSWIERVDLPNKSGKIMPEIEKRGPILGRVREKGILVPTRYEPRLLIVWPRSIRPLQLARISSLLHF